MGITVEFLERRTLFSSLLPGDANFDARVDGDDYAAIDAGFSTKSPGYHNGDFNGSGAVDGDDYWIIDGNAGKTNADVTGPSRPDLLKSSSSITTSRDGQVIENVDVTGEIIIKHNNVVLRNFRLNSTGYYGIRIFDTGSTSASNVIIEDGEITGWAGTAAIYGPSCTIRRLNIHHLTADAIKPWRHHVIENNWIHHLGMSDGQHADGIQMSGCVDIVIRNNFIDVPDGLIEGGNQFLGNAAIFLNNAFGQSDDIKMENNYFNGGNYTIYSLSATNVRIANNFFGRDFNFGVKNLWGAVVWQNNRWTDTGAVIA